jgi:mono/diheme cytochrome c family protein
MGVWGAVLLTLAAVASFSWAQSDGQRPGQGSGESVAESDAALVARGEKLVKERCASCHATGQSDKSANPKAPPFRRVGRLYPPEHLAEALAEGISTGAPEMPEYKFGPKDIDAIIAYLEEMAAGRK